MKYLRVIIEGPSSTVTSYEPLDPLTEYTEADLDGVARDMVHEVYTYGHAVVDEDEVPDGCR